MLLRRPDVLEAEHLLRSANAQHRRRARGLLSDHQSDHEHWLGQRAHLSALFKSGTGDLDFLPQVTLPIFHGGELVGNLSLAHTNREIAVAQYEKAIQIELSRGRRCAGARRPTLERQRAAQEALVAATAAPTTSRSSATRPAATAISTCSMSQRSDYSGPAGADRDTARGAEQSRDSVQALGGGWREQQSRSADP